MLNAVLKRVSQSYMNRNTVYDDDYYLKNHLRHVNSYYGFVIQHYYKYVAKYAMASVAKIKEGSRVLDIGCGAGILVKQFNKLGFNASGIDVHAAAIQNSIAADHCRLVESTARLDYPEGYFDMVVSREVLEHISNDDIDNCIAEWDRVSNGPMVHIIAVEERGPSATEDPTHINVQSEDWWVEKFRQHGFIAVRCPKKYFFSPFGNRGYFMFEKR